MRGSRRAILASMVAGTAMVAAAHVLTLTNGNDIGGGGPVLTGPRTVVALSVRANDPGTQPRPAPGIQLN